MMNKSSALAEIEKNADLFQKLSDSIWDHPELSLTEYRSAETYCTLLKALGFSVQQGLGHMETAFCGSYGTGRPVLGILGEFDALSGLSQAAGAHEPRELVPGGCGHGCGHNLLGAGALAAAYGVKRWLEENRRPGTVIFYGCPGEEGGAGKAFLAKEGLFAQLDAALTWHPDDVNCVVTGTNNSSLQKEYRFTGVASHAASSPHLGRSALDAAELMNVGVQFLREHMLPACRIHYAITDAGGSSPNVVQPHAQVLYMVRGIEVREAVELLARVDDIAAGAALMTGTKLDTRFIDGTANLLPNFALEALLQENFEHVGVPVYTKAEKEEAQRYIDTFEMRDTSLPFVNEAAAPELRAFIRTASNNGRKPLNDFLVPLHSNEGFTSGSTDVGDVSHVTPTAQIRAVTFPSKQPAHSWQNVACGKSSFAYKGLLCAAKVLAGTAIDLCERPDVLAKAQEEFAGRLTEPFLSPIPDGAQPTVVGGAW